MFDKIDAVMTEAQYKQRFFSLRKIKTTELYPLECQLEAKIKADSALVSKVSPERREKLRDVLDALISVRDYSVSSDKKRIDRLIALEKTAELLDCKINAHEYLSLANYLPRGHNQLADTISEHLFRFLYYFSIFAFVGLPIACLVSMVEVPFAAFGIYLIIAWACVPLGAMVVANLLALGYILMKGDKDDEIFKKVSAIGVFAMTCENSLSVESVVQPEAP